jgi:hypothetical protein
MPALTPRKLGADVVPDAVATGRYYPSSHREHADDTLTQTIRASKVDRAHDAALAQRIHTAALRAWPMSTIDTVVTLPPKPGILDRMAGLRAHVARGLDARDGADVLHQAFDVPGYRAMTIAERRATPRGRFHVTRSVSGLHVLLADDVVTSGVQARQAVHALLRAGAATVRFVAIAHAVDAPEDARRRHYATCLCSPDRPCVACPLAHRCSCGAAAGQRCRRPSGHRGHFVMTHEDRQLRSDADAIVRDPAEVETRLRAQRHDPDAMQAWARALRGLTRQPSIWRDRIDPTLIAHYLELATAREKKTTAADVDDAHRQLTLLP